MPDRTKLKEVKSGDSITAAWANNIVHFLKGLRITGPAVQETSDGWNIRRLGDKGGHKWVIVRGPIGDTDVTIEVEDAVKHPDYAVPGPNLGRWWTRAENDGVSEPTQTMEVWPHRLGKHYKEYAWDGATVVRETQVLLAHYVNGTWHAHPDPPFVMRERPINDVQTPCTPQGLI